MPDMANRKESAFRFWARTGRLPAAESGVETKYNHNHDPETGRFTFSDGGGNGGRGEQTAGLQSWAIRNYARKYPQIVGNTRSVVNRLTDNKLTPKELDYLTEHVFNNINIMDAISLGNVNASLPVVLNQKQFSVVQGIISKLPADQFGVNIRSYFDEARKNGKIVIRQK